MLLPCLQLFMALLLTYWALIWTQKTNLICQTFYVLVSSIADPDCKETSPAFKRSGMKFRLAFCLKLGTYFNCCYDSEALSLSNICCCPALTGSVLKQILDRLRTVA